jgi:hypothetical protein
MKALPPIKGRVGFEIVPFETHTGTQYAAMERPPAGAELAPGRALGKRRLMIVGIVWNRWHDGNSVAEFLQEATFPQMQKLFNFKGFAGVLAAFTASFLLLNGGS